MKPWPYLRHRHFATPSTRECHNVDPIQDWPNHYPMQDKNINKFGMIFHRPTVSLFGRAERKETVIWNKLNCRYVVSKGGRYVVGMWSIHGRYVETWNRSGPKGLEASERNDLIRNRKGVILHQTTSTPDSEYTGFPQPFLPSLREGTLFIGGGGGVGWGFRGEINETLE